MNNRSYFYYNYCSHDYYQSVIKSYDSRFFSLYRSYIAIECYVFVTYNSTVYIQLFKGAKLQVDVLVLELC